MNFLGMGPLELMLIVVLALIVFGPAKLPEIMGQVGRAIGDFRRATSELSDEFNRTIQAELNETKQTIEETKSALTEVRSAVDSTMNETRAAVAGAPVSQHVATTTPPAVETNGAVDREESGGANGSTPPLADTSQWSWETSPGRTDTSASVSGEAVAAPADAASGATDGTESGAADEAVVTEASTPNEAVSNEAAGSSDLDAHDSGTPPRERNGRDELQPPY
jgi:sec-independent protein translocase protein TatB